MYNIPSKCIKCGKHWNDTVWDDTDVKVRYRALHDTLECECGRCGYTESCEPDDKEEECDEI